jgi:hypothetical protein
LGELEGKQGVSAGGGSATVKCLRLQVLKLEKEKRLLVHDLVDAESARGAAAATAEDDMRHLRAVIETQKEDNVSLAREIAHLSEKRTASASSTEEAIGHARDAASAAEEEAAIARRGSGGGGGGGGGGGSNVTDAAAADHTVEEDSPPLTPKASRDASTTPRSPRQASDGSGEGEDGREEGKDGGGSLKERIEQLEMECAAAEAAAVKTQKILACNAVKERRAGVAEGARRYAAKAVNDLPPGVPGENGWTSLLVDKTGAVTAFPSDFKDEDKDLVHCSETDLCMELTLESAELLTEKGGGGERIRVMVDASAAAATGSHEPIELPRIATAIGERSLVNISTQVHVVVPVTRDNLRSLLTRPVRVELHMLSSSSSHAADDTAGGGDGDYLPPPPPPDWGKGDEGGDGKVDDVVVGLVLLRNILRDEYPEAFGGTGLVGPGRGAMYGTPGPAPYQITLLRRESSTGGGGAWEGEGDTVGHVTVRARFRRSAAAVLALFNSVNDALEVFEGNEHALAAAKVRHWEVMTHAYRTRTRACEPMNFMPMLCGPQRLLGAVTWWVYGSTVRVCKLCGCVCVSVFNAFRARV